MESVDTAFFLLPEGIVLESASVTETEVVVQIACRHPHAACPQCHSCSQRVHSHYIRTVADLPCAGRRVVLRLSVRKFVCGTPTCPQRIFTEQLTSFVQSYTRMTNRLREVLVALGMTTGGESGERLASRLGMPVSAPTLLRQMRQVVLPPPQTVHLGHRTWLATCWSGRAPPISCTPLRRTVGGKRRTYQLRKCCGAARLGMRTACRYSIRPTKSDYDSGVRLVRGGVAGDLADAGIAASYLPE